jgi:hypothetical protein
MDMEVNLLMGGRGETAAYSPVQDDPPLRMTPTGGHLDPTMFGAFAPGVLPLTVEEGIADGVDQVRRAERHLSANRARE